jgi:hypothetical protein
VPGDQLGEEVVARLGTIAAERLRPRHLIDGGVQRLHDRRRQRLGRIADAEADELGLRVRRLELLHPPRDLAEEITALEA